MSTASLAFCALWPILTTASLAHEPATISAQQWFNLSTISIPAPPTRVLVFFSTRLPDAFVPLIPHLNRIDQRPDVVVYGLTPESSRRVETFVEQHRIKFAVGAGSPNDRHFGVRRWPQIVVLKSSCRNMSADRAQVERTMAALTDLESRLNTDVGDDKATAATSAIDPDKAQRSAEIDRLRAVALEDPDPEERMRALGILRTLLSPEGFLSVLDAVLSAEPPAWYQDWWQKRPIWYGDIAYMRHMADPSQPNKQGPPPGLLVIVQQEADLVDLAYAEAYVGELRKMTNEELRDEYLSHLSDADRDLLIRQKIEAVLMPRSDSPEVRRVFLELLPYEPDAYMRYNLAGDIGFVCQPGDTEAIEVLNTALDAETDIRWARPMMQEAIHYLSTGDKGSATKAKPAPKDTGRTDEDKEAE